MRRAASVLVVLGIALAVGAAPAHGVGPLAGGVKGGLAMHKFTGDDARGSPDWRTAWAAGGFLTLGLGSSLALQPELLYVRKGAKFEWTAMDEFGEPIDDGESHYKFDYLDLPVLVKYTLPTAGRVRPCVFAGPVASLKMSARYVSDAIGVLEPAVDEEVDEVKSLDFGLALGAGVAFPAGGRTLSVDVRYTAGLTDWPDIDEDVSNKNGGWLAMLGIGF